VHNLISFLFLRNEGSLAWSGPGTKQKLTYTSTTRTASYRIFLPFWAEIDSFGGLLRVALLSFSVGIAPYTTPCVLSVRYPPTSGAPNCAQTSLESSLFLSFDLVLVFLF